MANKKVDDKELEAVQAKFQEFVETAGLELSVKIMQICFIEGYLEGKKCSKTEL